MIPSQEASGRLVRRTGPVVDGNEVLKAVRSTAVWGGTNDLSWHGEPRAASVKNMAKGARAWFTSDLFRT